MMSRAKTITQLGLSLLTLGMLTARSTDSRAEGVQVHGVNFMVKTVLDESFCLDASLDRGQEGREVYIYKCHGRENQRWTFTDGADGASAIIGHLGMCLDIRGRKTRDGTP